MRVAVLLPTGTIGTITHKSCVNNLMSIIRLLDKENVVYTDIRILFSIKKEGNSAQAGMAQLEHCPLRQKDYGFDSQ